MKKACAGLILAAISSHLTYVEAGGGSARDALAQAATRVQESDAAADALQDHVRTRVETASDDADTSKMVQGQHFIAFYNMSSCYSMLY